MELELKNKLLAVVLAIGILAVQGCASEKPLDGSSFSAVIDVRSKSEFDLAHLQGALNIDVEKSDFDEKINQLDKAASYLVYCATGSRSSVAVQHMQELGFTGPISNAGGMAAASELSGIPVVK